MKLALILVAILGAQADGSGLAVPDRAAQAAAERLIDAVYGEKLKAAKTPEAKSKLAREILEVVKEEPDAANKYVGLQTVKRLAVEAEDGALGLEAVKVLAATFASETGADAETLIRQAEALWEAAERKRGTDQLAGRLEAVELWLRSGSTSPLMAKKWEERIEQVKSGGAIVLHARQARVVGVQAAYSEPIQCVRDWKDPREYIEWHIDLDKGEYELFLEFASFGKGAGSLFGVSIFHSQTARPISTSSFVLRSTGGWRDFSVAALGKVAIHDDGRYIIRLHVVRKVSRDLTTGLINVRALRLQRI